MSRTQRVNIYEIDIYPFRHSTGRSYRKAASCQEKELEYQPRARQKLSQSNLTSSWDDVYKGVFRDKWVGKSLCPRFVEKHAIRR